MKNPVPIPVIEFLSHIVQEHVKAYQTDFDYDTVILTKAVQKPAEQDRTFYWMGRECGTWCFKERDVFLCDTEQNRTWLHYAGDTGKIRAYRVTVTGLEDGKVMGIVCPINYAAQIQRIQNSALPIAEIKLIFQDGEQAILPYKGWEEHKRLIEEMYGPYEIFDMPANEDELSECLRREHQIQSKEAGAFRSKRVRHEPTR